MELQEAIELVEDYRGDGWSPRVGEALEALIVHARRSLDAPKAEPEEDPGRNPEVDNLWRAVQIVRETDQLRGVVAELKSAFARNELDGGVKAASDHPLYIQAQARLTELHEQLVVLI